MTNPQMRRGYHRAPRMAFHGIGNSSGSIDCARPLWIDLDQRRGQPDVVLGDLELRRRAQAPQHPVGAKTDDRLVGPGHPDIGQERGAVAQDAGHHGRHVV